MEAWLLVGSFDLEKYVHQESLSDWTHM